MLIKKEISALIIFFCLFLLLFQTVGCKKDYYTPETIQGENESEIIQGENESEIPLPEDCPQETHYCPISNSCVPDSTIEQGLQSKLECPYITLSWDKDEKAVSYEIIPFYDGNKDGIEDGKCEEDISNTRERYLYYNLESSDCAAYYIGNVRFQIIPQYSDGLSIESYNTEWIDVSVCDLEATICTDSDGGKNIYKKGITKGNNVYGNPVEYQDECMYEDRVREYYCENENSNTYYVSKASYPCPNGCEDGACICDMINTLADGELKTYTIKGIDYDVRPIITTNIYPYHVQFVVNGELTELLGTGNTFILSNGARITVIEILPNEAGDVTQDLVEFCLNGENDLEATICTDSDGGKDYYVKGITVGLAADGVVTTRTDSCRLNNYYGDGYDYVIEWFCLKIPDDGKIYAVNTNEKCPNGCKDGACIKDSGTDLEIKSVTKRDSDSYGFYTTICVHGSKTMNDLKSEISGLNFFPIGYIVFDANNNGNYKELYITGAPDDLKNGECKTFSWTMNFDYDGQAMFDKYGKIEVVLDSNNLIKETNENNNVFLYQYI